MFSSLFQESAEQTDATYCEESATRLAVGHNENRENKNVPGSWAASYGVKIVKLGNRNDRRCLYHVTWQMQVPWRSRRKLMIFRAIVKFPYFWQTGRLVSRVQVRNVVPKDGQVVRACELGDVEVLRDLFIAKQASILDVSDEMKPLLWVSPLHLFNRVLKPY
jgi:hypothetical protein